MIKKTFLTFFPAYEDIHFWKDPGQIPFRFKNLCYDSKILTRKNGEYPISNKYLDVEFLETKLIFNKDLNLIAYFIKNSKRIDVLNVFHLQGFESLLAAFVYKVVNPNGFVYLKMDNCHSVGIYPWEKIFDKNVVPVSFLATPKESWNWKIKKLLLKYLFIKKIDLFSVEDEESKKYFENKYSFFKDKLIVAFNGHTIDLVDKGIQVKSFEEKENLVITVGRLGISPSNIYNKNTLNFLKGFAASADKHNWNLILAGPIAPNFISEKDKFMIQHPELENRIKFAGNLGKPELFELYNSAKIFLFPSLFETFSNVFSEAMYFKNAIITTPYTSLKQYVTNEKLGILVEPESPQEIGDAIIELINHPVRLEQMCNNSKNFADENLNWDDIVNKKHIIMKNIKDTLCEVIASD